VNQPPSLLPWVHVLLQDDGLLKKLFVMRDTGH
jgi:hypothetical protein